MLKEEIVVGKAYVNERACIVREVIEEVDSRHVRYVAFELESGKLLPARHSLCGKRDLQRWADREADSRERNRIHPYRLQDEMLPRSQDALHPDEARVMSDLVPGAHTFPGLK